MFEISGADITTLNDVDLRSLVQRLATAELRAKECPISSVTAGGNQDAADGGLDVRVECSEPIFKPDFVPRQITGFQVKKPDMPASAIRDEMRPEGLLRDVIRDLAITSGAYIIVSAQGSVADKPLIARRKAIRDALHDLPNALKLHTDFYDRDRLANWVNEYPGIVAWVRSRVGRPLSGWSGIDDWQGSAEGESKPYLFNDEACLVDERSRDREFLPILEGISRLRSSLRKNGQCTRLVGLSGLGKTRLVKALFEDGVGNEPLDPSIAIYTDYSERTDPTARDMARDLVGRGQRAILIIDNCNPATHSETARLCSGSKVSLITVEYDVQDDEPEGTEVFRLKSSSPELVANWIEECFPEISQVDRDKIAKFSDGNFRVARALAETLEKGKTLGSLRDRELFERIFQQRKAHDKQLLHAAEYLSLLYSVDGEDTSTEGELFQVSGLSNIDVRHLYEALVEMRRRGVAQARGRFRAILPQAIANPLAAHALERIPPIDFDRFCASLNTRMAKSVSRRIGFLHDYEDAQTTVARWLRSDGPLGDLTAPTEINLQILTNIAPVAPHAALAAIKRRLDTADGHLIFAPGGDSRHLWAQLIKALGYDATLFDSAVMLLARFLATELDEPGHNLIQDSFRELFFIYLSGTQATPAQRRTAIKKLAILEDPMLRRCASIALNSLLESRHFVAMSHFDFGARSRDWGWCPETSEDVRIWFDEAIALTIELAPYLPDHRKILASHIRSLWLYAGSHDALDRAATAFTIENPWIQGWLAFRSALRCEREEMSRDIRARLRVIVDRLKPTDLLHQARAVVLSRASFGWDFADDEEDDGDGMKSWEKANKMAREVGKLLADDNSARAEFLPELIGSLPVQRAFQCGRGLAEGAQHLDAMWDELLAAYKAREFKPRSEEALGGLLSEACRIDRSFVARALESTISNPGVASLLPYFQAHVGIDEEGIERLRRAIAVGVLDASNFNCIATGIVSVSPPLALAEMLQDIADLVGGVRVALNILGMHFYRYENEQYVPNSRLVGLGRDLLVRIDFRDDELIRDFGLQTVMKICLVGEEGQITAGKICENIREASGKFHIRLGESGYILSVLFEIQPLISLDAFLLSSSPTGRRLLLGASFERLTPIEQVDSLVLRQWADHDARNRYPLIGECLSMFRSTNGGEGNDFSPIFLSMLEVAPDKRAFLGGLWNRMNPGSWSGSLADILLQRREKLLALAEQSGDEVKAWISDAVPELDAWIERERDRDREREESFE